MQCASTAYWQYHDADPWTRSRRSSDCFLASTLPAEVIEAVAADLTILKSLIVLRDAEGRCWGRKGHWDIAGCCQGRCPHVWNCTQAVALLLQSWNEPFAETSQGHLKTIEDISSFAAICPSDSPCTIFTEHLTANRAAS